MKPAPFEYLAPRTLEEALALVARHGDGAKILAGGQSLIPLLNFRLAQPALLIDLNGVAELSHVRETAGGGLSVGAMTRVARLEREALVAARCPLLAETVPHVAHPQIRNRGTLGGSLAHADPSAELPAVLLALDGGVRLRGPRGERRVAAGDFFVGLLATSLEPDELLIEVELPASAKGTGWAFLEIARRHGDYAQIGLAATVTLDASSRCTAARLAFLSAGDTPLLATRAAASLLGETASDSLFAAVANAIQSEIDPVDDVQASAAFKRHLAGVVTRRALATAWQRALGAHKSGGGA